VIGHRWSLQFEKGSLPDDETITIKDHDPDILDVQFGPHGTKFGVPVTLTIDFQGTSCDPGTAEWDQREPVLYWLDETTNTWSVGPPTGRARRTSSASSTSRATSWAARRGGRVHRHERTTTEAHRVNDVEGCFNTRRAAPDGPRRVRFRRAPALVGDPPTLVARKRALTGA
jgi:hypothetical protein